MKKGYIKLIALLPVMLVMVAMAVAGQPLTAFDPYGGPAILLFINVTLYIFIFWLINNQTVNVQKLIQKFGDSGAEKVVTAIKVEIFIKNIGLFALCILNLIVSGFFYHAWSEIETHTLSLAFLIVAMNIIIILFLFLLFVVQVWYFPFKFVKDTVFMLKDEVNKNDGRR